MTGHVGFGLHRELAQSTAYITLLRDPVERLISNFYWASSYPHSPFLDDIRSGRMDLRGYADHFAIFDSDNLQMRMLAGNWFKRGFGPATAEMAAEARANLRAHFLVVGVTPRFDEFLLLLRRRLGWGWPWGWPLYVRSNVSKAGPRQVPLAADLRAHLDEITRFDRELYLAALAMVDEAVAAEGRLFQLELALFRRVNGAYGALYHVARRVYRRLRPAL